MSLRVVENFEACSDGLNSDFQTRDSNEYILCLDLSSKLRTRDLYND